MESENMEENKNSLDEINKGCTIAIEAINNLIDKVDNKDFKKVILKQLDHYHEIESKINELYTCYSQNEPHEVGPFIKMMNNYMTSVKTMMDHTDSKIAEMLLQGTNMGIIEGERILNNKKVDKDIEKIIKCFIKDQEAITEDLKKYL